GWRGQFVRLAATGSRHPGPAARLVAVAMTRAGHANCRPAHTRAPHPHRRYSMPTRSTSSRGGPAAKNKVIAMLKADHKKVKKAFKDFEKLDAQEDPDSAQALVEQTCTELEVHAELEEQVFYPAARGAMKEDDLIDEA